jgi:hypothetical protein
MNIKKYFKGITAVVLSTFTVLTLAGGVLQSVSANGGAGSGGSGGGVVTGDNPGYTIWYDQWGADGEPLQGWGEASMNNMQARIESTLGKTMQVTGWRGTTAYLDIYQKAAREALADAQARSQTGRARIVGVSSIYYDGGSKLQTAYDSKTNVMRLAGTRPGTAEELPDNTGWSTTYNNNNGATGANWRDWLEQYGVAKAQDTNLTMIVWAVAEGEPVPPNIDMALKKVNGAENISKDNSCYAQDLSGAVYEVHRKQDLSDTPLYILTTKADGSTDTISSIPFDATNPYLYVKEVKAPKGFKLDPTTYIVSPYKRDTWNIVSTDEPMNDPATLKLMKKSVDKVDDPAPLEDAEFTVKYYAGQYTFDNLPETPTRTLVYKTVNFNGNYIMDMSNEQCLVSGEPYKDKQNNMTFPLGTITVEETKAPKGYTLENKVFNGTTNTELQTKNGVMLFNITEEGTDAIVQGGNHYVASENINRQGFSIQKVDEETNNPIGIAEFKILNNNNYDIQYNHKDGSSEIIKAGEQSQETVVTDEKGSYTSAENALQVGKYQLVETKSPNNYLINQNTDFEIKNDAELNTISVNIVVADVKMHTTAIEEQTQKNVLDGSKTEQTVVDTVKYKHLIPGKTYTITGELAVKPAGKTVGELQSMSEDSFERVKNDGGEVIKEIVTFTPTTPDGEVQVKFKVNPSKYAGHKLVAFEDMHDGNLLIGHHADITDENQTVTVSMDIELTVVKADEANHNKFLQGAEITIYNQDGTVAKDKNGKDAIGTTDENGKVTFKLAYDQDNEMYAMETNAPKGYTLSTEKYAIKRTGNDKLGIDNVSITILDSAIPPTGVKSNLVIFGTIGVLAVVALVFITKKQKKE